MLNNKFPGIVTWLSGGKKCENTGSIHKAQALEHEE